MKEWNVLTDVFRIYLASTFRRTIRITALRGHYPHTPQRIHPSHDRSYELRAMLFGGGDGRTFRQQRQATTDAPNVHLSGDDGPLLRTTTPLTRTSWSRHDHVPRRTLHCWPNTCVTGAPDMLELWK